MPTLDPSIHARVAVVSVSFGSEAVLPAFLASVCAAKPEGARVVIADNKPARSSPVQDIVAQSVATYLPMTGNLGYGTAVNAAVRSLADSAEWILISNPDVVLEPDSISRLLQTGDSDETIAAVGPRILTAEGKVYPSARAIPSLRNGIGHALFSSIWPDNMWSRSYRKQDRDLSKPQDAGWLSGACLLVRRSTFDEIGGFDEGYFMYFEDVDLGYRIGKLGLRNVYEPRAIVTHTGAHSTQSDESSMIVAHHESARRFLASKYSGPLLWPIRMLVTAGLTIRSKVAVKSGPKS
jgi:N-acetylglucosaminyl-diphospho-decaprenol L-rhamnosyltransferase